MNTNALSFAFILTLSSCSQNPSGSVKVYVVQPAGTSCQFKIAPDTIDGLDSLDELRGAVGKVVSYPKGRPDSKIEKDLDNGTGFDPVTTQFGKKDGAYFPLDYTTAFGTNLLYWTSKTIQKAAELFPDGDITKLANTKDTLIIQEAKIFKDEDGNPEKDNAGYYSFTVDGELKSYFIYWPLEKVKELPLGLNPGVVAHETTHMVFTANFREKAKKLGKDWATLRADNKKTYWVLNEGIADYLGFYMTRDPEFFLCSFKNATGRNLADPGEFTKEFVSKFYNTSDSEFDPHKGGSIWAAIQYEIGQAIKDHDKVAASNLQLAADLPNCIANATKDDPFTMARVAKCHMELSASREFSDVMKGIYEKRGATQERWKK